MDNKEYSIYIFLLDTDIKKWAEGTWMVNIRVQFILDSVTPYLETH